MGVGLGSVFHPPFPPTKNAIPAQATAYKLTPNQSALPHLFFTISSLRPVNKNAPFGAGLPTSFPDARHARQPDNYSFEINQLTHPLTLPTLSS